MVPVLVLCSAAFALTLGYHLAAMVGAVQQLSPASFWALEGIVVATGAASILTHPKSKMNGGYASLALWPCLKVIPAKARWAYLVLIVYSLVAALASAPGGGEGKGFAAMMQAPYFATAFMLFFASIALTASHSAILFYNHPFGFDEPDL